MKNDFPSSTQAPLRLPLRQGLYHCALVADGVLLAKERLLIEQR